MSNLPPWHSNIKRLTADAEDLYAKLYDTWQCVGISEQCQQMYYEQAHSHIIALMNDMLEEAGIKKEQLCKDIDVLYKEARALSAELKTDTQITDLNDLPLVEVRSTLMNQVQKLKQEKQWKLEHLQELLNRERKVCDSLGIKSFLRIDGVPAYEELESAKHELEKQEAEKLRLENIFKEMRHSIISIMDELNVNPTREFAVTVCLKPENFVYTSNNMAKLSELQEELKEVLDAAKKKADLKRGELVSLWKYLEAPEDSCRAFLDKYQGHGHVDLHAINEEIKSCKKKRSENIAKYVTKVRAELKELWDLCKFSEEQRKEFKPFAIKEYNENLLTLHDLEVARIREHYNRNKKLFDLVNERMTTWEKSMELNNRANDPERLHNRGGQLLIEEKERTLLRKKITKIDEQIAILIPEYEEQNREPFMVNGMSCMEYFERSLDEYQESQKNLKKERQAKAKDRSTRIKTPVMCTSRRTPVTMATSTFRMGQTSLRKRDDKSPLGNSAKRRLVHSEKSRPTICASKVRRSGRAPRRLVRAMETTRKTETINDTQASLGSVAQYEQFQEHLEQREELRSSLLPDKVLRNASNRSKMRTPVKTPVKPLRKCISNPSTPNRTPKTSHLRSQSKSPKLTSATRLVAARSNVPFLF